MKRQNVGGIALFLFVIIFFASCSEKKPAAENTQSPVPETVPVIVPEIKPAAVSADEKGTLPDYSGFWGNEKEVNVLDLAEFYPERLPYIRNEIYARYGRPFTTPAYKEYFLGKSWYRVREDYSDAWLSKTDVKNAEFIRSIEQPALNFEDTIAAVLKNIEYKNDDAVLTFTSRKNVIWTDPDIDFGAYGLNGYNAQNMDWLVMGDWIIVYKEYSYGITAYKLDHKSKTILDSVSAALGADALERIIRLQENR